jgi:hypothetical protein
MNQNMIRKKETTCTMDNTGMFKLTKTWIHNQSTVFSVDIHCYYCDQTYHGHNSTFKKHLSTKKHKDNFEEHEQYCRASMEEFNRREEEE